MLFITSVKLGVEVCHGLRQLLVQLQQRPGPVDEGVQVAGQDRQVLFVLGVLLVLYMGSIIYPLDILLEIVFPTCTEYKIGFLLSIQKKIISLKIIIKRK